MGFVVNAMPRQLFFPKKIPSSIVLEDDWAPEPVWTGAENFAPTGL